MMTGKKRKRKKREIIFGRAPIGHSWEYKGGTIVLLPLCARSAERVVVVVAGAALFFLPPPPPFHSFFLADSMDRISIKQSLNTILLSLSFPLSFSSVRGRTPPPSSIAESQPRPPPQKREVQLLFSPPYTTEIAATIEFKENSTSKTNSRADLQTSVKVEEP